MKYKISEKDIREITEKTVEKYVLDTLKSRTKSNVTWESHINTVIWSVVSNKLQEIDMAETLILEIEKHIPEEVQKRIGIIERTIKEKTEKMLQDTIELLLVRTQYGDGGEHLSSIFESYSKNIPDYISQIINQNMEKRILEGFKKILFEDFGKYIDFNAFIRDFNNGDR